MEGSENFEELIERRKKGSLKIYLGYAAGVGKTFSMLQEANRLKARGLDVVIGYVEPHARPETSAQIGSLEILPKTVHEVAGRRFEEMDLSAILARKPQVVIVDELAHTNIAGAKHEKRYQDILEILDHQINVITTFNIQHLESVADKITGVTKVPIVERVPDFILQRADQIVNIDVPIEDLRDRLRLGKIYDRDRAERALVNFFSNANLSLLRQTALREAAGDQIRRTEAEEYFAGAAASTAQEGIMIALSSDPTNAAILLRKGARLASQLSSKCYAVYVQRKSENPTNIEASLQRKLQKTFDLANSFDIEVVILQAEDVSESLVSFAHERGVRYAIFGKSRLSPLRERLRGSVLLDFIHDSVGIDVHIVCPTGE